MIIHHLDKIGLSPEVNFVYKKREGGLAPFMRAVVSADGNYKAVATFKNADQSDLMSVVRIYRRRSDAVDDYEEIQSIDGISNRDKFGYAMAFSADGSNLIITAMYETVNGLLANGAVYYYRRNSNDQYEQYWRQALGLDAGSEYLYFGIGCAMSADGNTTFISSTGDWGGRGNIKVYNRIDENSEYQYLGEMGPVIPVGWHGGRTICYDDKKKVLYVSDETSHSNLYRFKYNPEDYTLTQIDVSKFPEMGTNINFMSLEESTGLLWLGRNAYSSSTHSIFVKENANGKMEIFKHDNIFLDNDYTLAESFFGYNGEFHVHSYPASTPPASDKVLGYRAVGYIYSDPNAFTSGNASVEPVIHEDGGLGFITGDETCFCPFRRQSVSFADIRKNEHLASETITLSPNGKYLFGIDIGDGNVQSSGRIHRYIRGVDGEWLFDMVIPNYTTNANSYSELISDDNGDVLVVLSNTLSKLYYLRFDYSQDIYVLDFELSIDINCYRIDGKVDDFVLGYGWDNGTDGAPRVGTVQHIKVDLDTKAIVSKKVIRPATVTASYSYWGHGLSVFADYLAVGAPAKDGGSVEIFKLNAEGDYSYQYRFHVNEFGLATSGYDFGYGCCFSSDGFLYISRTPHAANIASVYRFSLDDSFVTDNTKRLAAKDDWEVKSPVPVAYWGNKLRADNYGRSILAGGSGSQDLYSISLAVENPAPTLIITSTMTGRAGHFSRMSADGSTLIVNSIYASYDGRVNKGELYVLKRDIYGKFSLFDIIREPVGAAGTNFAICAGVSSDGKIIVAGYENQATVSNPVVFELVGASYIYRHQLPHGSASWAAVGSTLINFSDNDDVLYVGAHGEDHQGVDSGGVRIYVRERKPTAAFKYLTTISSGDPAGGKLFGVIGTSSISGKRAALSQRILAGNSAKYETFIYKPYYNMAGVYHMPATQTIFNDCDFSGELLPLLEGCFMRSGKYMVFNTMRYVNTDYQTGFILYEEMAGVYVKIDEYFESLVNGNYLCTATFSEDGETMSYIRNFGRADVSVEIITLRKPTGYIEGDDYNLSRVMLEGVTDIQSILSIPSIL